MNAPEGLLYSKDHEWVKLEGDRALIGITDYAQHALGSIVFVELPAVGRTVAASDPIGTVESVKSVSDIYCPVSGTIAEVNSQLESEPEKLNREPYESWIAALESAKLPEDGGLMSAEEYTAFCSKEE